MEIKPQIFFSKVMHKRFFPKENSFNYNIYYLIIPLLALNNKSISDLKINKFGLVSFYEKDHGQKNGSNLYGWIIDILKEKNINIENLDILLVCMPRIMGYVFNPVSFYFCFDQNKKLKAVISQVNNTFKESHTYICIKNDYTDIKDIDIIEAQKVFHVSPFLKTEGKYQFRFNYKKNKIGIWIDYFNKEGKKELATSLTGNYENLTKINLIKAFFYYPLVTLKTIFLIHYQAIKLLYKRVKYIAKPRQKKDKITTSLDIIN